MLGFIIWSLVCLVIIGIGISTWRAKEAAGFFTGVKPPKVKDAKRYNHMVAILWFVYAALFELLGLPLLFLEQNSPLFVVPVLGVPALTIVLVAGYMVILRKNR